MGRKSNTSISLEMKHYQIIDDHEINLSKFVRQNLEKLEEENEA